MTHNDAPGTEDFRIVLTGDFTSADGQVYFDAEALKALAALPGAQLDVLSSGAGEAVTSRVTRDADVVIMKRSPLAAGVLEDAALRTICISRNGVGYDHLDIDACTRAGVMVATTPNSVRRATAGAAVTLLLACAHRLLERDRLVRGGAWKQRHSLVGTGLQGKTLGLIGAGNIGREILELLAPWGLRRLISSPRRTPREAAALGAELADFDDLLRRADFLVLACRLSEETHHLIDARALSLVKPGAFIINIARGEVIDEAALVEALKSGPLAGAGLDVLAQEPPAADNPLFALDNVVLSPHSLGFSEESNRLGNSLAAENAAAVAYGKVPESLVNPEVLDHPRIRNVLAARTAITLRRNSAQN